MKKDSLKLLTSVFFVFITLFLFFITPKADEHVPEFLQFFFSNQTSLSYDENSIVVNFHHSDSQFIDYLQNNYLFEITFLYDTTYHLIFDENFYSIADVLIILQDYPLVNFAEPNYTFESLALPTNEALYSQQWAYNHNIYGINIVDVWSETLGNPDITVAIIDTGIFYTHIDFVQRIWTNPNEIPDNEIDDDQNGYIDDYYGWDFGDNNNDPKDESGHGTFIAGIVAAAVNDWGITGTAPGVKMMGLKVENAAGEIFLHSILNAINYGLDQGVRIFNLSFVSTHYSISFENLLASADAIFLCGAGNDTINNDITPYYPASYDLDNIISVASINSNGQLSWFSNYGPTSVHIAAPGENILSTWIPQGGYWHALGQGTSFSAPFVAGVAALLLSKDPDLTPQQVREAILMSSKKLPSLDGKITTGGILDAYAAYTYNFDPPTIILGDLNGDDLVTISDLIILRQHFAGIEELEELYLPSADINQDGSVTISDLIKLRRYLAGLEEL